MRRGVKKREGENLTDANIKKVIQLLSAETPISKKEACNILNISYNTTRLNKVIEEYEENVQYRKTRMAQKRGRPATKDEIAQIAEEYLGGESFSDIGKRIFRSVKDEKAHIEYLPEECVAEEFEVGEIAWSAKYHTSCEVMAKLEDTYNDKYNTSCYRIWVREPTDSMQEFGGFNAYVPAYDLGKLEHLKEYGLNTKRL
jgi:ATP-dependent Lon protease